jgi:hypothetical protein
MQPEQATTLPRAMSRLLGAWLGMFALCLTYAAAVLSGVGAPTAMVRSVIAWAIFLSAGRAIGWFAGRSCAASLRKGDGSTPGRPRRVEAEAGA